MNYIYINWFYIYYGNFAWRSKLYFKKSKRSLYCGKWHIITETNILISVKSVSCFNLENDEVFIIIEQHFRSHQFLCFPGVCPDLLNRSLSNFFRVKSSMHPWNNGLVPLISRTLSLTHRSHCSISVIIKMAGRVGNLSSGCWCSPRIFHSILQDCFLCMHNGSYYGLYVTS